MSLGAVSIDDTLDDAMDEDTFDTIEDYDELDDLFAPPDAKDGPRPGEGLHKELVISVIAEIPITQHLKSGLFALGTPSNTPVSQHSSREALLLILE
jgi:anaphase-promoting complex subunit 1